MLHLQPLTPCGFDEVVLVSAIGHSYGDYGRNQWGTCRQRRIAVVSVVLEIRMYLLLYLVYCVLGTQVKNGGE